MVFRVDLGTGKLLERLEVPLRELDRLKHYRARSRLYRSRLLQPNIRLKALAEIYTMHSFAPFFNLKISAKNRHHFFAIE